MSDKHVEVIGHEDLKNALTGGEAGVVKLLKPNEKTDASKMTKEQQAEYRKKIIEDHANRVDKLLALINDQTQKIEGKDKLVVTDALQSTLKDLESGVAKELQTKADENMLNLQKRIENTRKAVVNAERKETSFYEPKAIATEVKEIGRELQTGGVKSWVKYGVIVGGVTWLTAAIVKSLWGTTDDPGFFRKVGRWILGVGAGVLAAVGLSRFMATTDNAVVNTIKAGGDVIGGATDKIMDTGKKTVELGMKDVKYWTDLFSSDPDKGLDNAWKNGVPLLYEHGQFFLKLETEAVMLPALSIEKMWNWAKTGNRDDDFWYIYGGAGAAYFCGKEALRFATQGKIHIPVTRMDIAKSVGRLAMGPLAPFWDAATVLKTGIFHGAQGWEAMNLRYIRSTWPARIASTVERRWVKTSAEGLMNGLDVYKKTQRECEIMKLFSKGGFNMFSEAELEGALRAKESFVDRFQKALIAFKETEDTPEILKALKAEAHLGTENFDKVCDRIINKFRAAEEVEAKAAKAVKNVQAPKTPEKPIGNDGASAKEGMPEKSGIKKENVKLVNEGPLNRGGTTGLAAGETALGVNRLEQHFATVEQAVSTAEKSAVHAQELSSTLKTLPAGSTEALTVQKELQATVTQGQAAIESAAQAGETISKTQVSRLGKVINALKTAGKVLGLLAIPAEVWSVYDYTFNERPKLVEQMEKEKNLDKKGLIQQKIEYGDLGAGWMAVSTGVTFVPGGQLIGLGMFATGAAWKHTVGRLHEGVEYYMQTEHGLAKESPGHVLKQIDLTQTGSLNWATDLVMSFDGHRTEVNDAVRSTAYAAYFRQRAPFLLPELTQSDLPESASDQKKILQNAQQYRASLFALSAEQYIKKHTGGSFVLVDTDVLRRAETYATLRTSEWQAHFHVGKMVEGEFHMNESSTLTLGGKSVQDFGSIEQRITKHIADNERNTLKEIDSINKNPESINKAEFEDAFSYGILSKVTHELAMAELTILKFEPWFNAQDKQIAARMAYTTEIQSILERTLEGIRSKKHCSAADIEGAQREILALLKTPPDRLYEKHYTDEHNAISRQRIAGNKALLSVPGLMSFIQSHPYKNRKQNPDTLSPETKNKLIQEVRQKEGEQLMRDINANNNGTYFTKQYGAIVNKYLYMRFNDGTSQWEVNLGSTNEWHDPKNFSVEMSTGQKSYDNLLVRLRAINGIIPF